MREMRKVLIAVLAIFFLITSMSICIQARDLGGDGPSLVGGGGSDPSENVGDKIIIDQGDDVVNDDSQNNPPSGGGGNTGGGGGSNNNDGSEQLEDEELSPPFIVNKNTIMQRYSFMMFLKQGESAQLTIDAPKHVYDSLEFTVTIMCDGIPVEGAEVTFQGQIYYTDGSGQVDVLQSYTVTHSESFRITATKIGCLSLILYTI